MRCTTIFLLPFATAVGCTSARMAMGTTEPIQTDSPINTVAESNGVARVAIRMTYRNSTGKPVYLPTCQGPQPPRLQKQIGDKWVVAFAPNVLACEATPIEIPNNTSYLPRFAVSEVPGTYRILWEIFHGAAGEPSHPVITRDALPTEQEVSNTFQLVR